MGGDVGVSHRAFKVIILAAFLVLGSYLLFIQLTGAINSMHVLDKAMLRFDPLFSQTFCKDVTTWLEQSGHEYNTSVYQELKKQFSGIAAIVARQKIAKKAVVFLQASSPFVRLNNDLVLTANASVVPQSYFEPDTIDQLPLVSVNSIVPDSTYFSFSSRMNALHAIVSDLVEQFDVTWFNETTILFNDKHSALWSLCSDIYHIPTDLAVDRYRSVVQAMKEKKSSNKKVQSWVADMRFAEQIVVYGTKGGKNEATK